MPGRCDSVFVIILDTMYFVVSQKKSRIRKCENVKMCDWMRDPSLSILSTFRVIRTFSRFRGHFRSRLFLRYDEIHCV